MTYAELKSKIDALTPEQLAQPVQVVGEFFRSECNDLWVLTEDHINPSGDAWEPKSAYADDSEFDADDEPIVAKEGDIFLTA